MHANSGHVFSVCVKNWCIGIPWVLNKSSEAELQMRNSPQHLCTRQNVYFFNCHFHYCHCSNDFSIGNFCRGLKQLFCQIFDSWNRLGRNSVKVSVVVEKVCCKNQTVITIQPLPFQFMSGAVKFSSCFVLLHDTIISQRQNYLRWQVYKQ